MMNNLFRRNRNVKLGYRFYICSDHNFEKPRSSLLVIFCYFLLQKWIYRKHVIAAKPSASLGDATWSLEKQKPKIREIVIYRNMIL